MDNQNTEITIREDESGVYEVYKSGYDNDIIIEVGTNPSETYFSQLQNETQNAQIQIEQEEFERQNKISEVDNLRSIIQTKVDNSQFDTEYFSALGRFQLLTREASI